MDSKWIAEQIVGCAMDTHWDVEATAEAIAQAAAQERADALAQCRAEMVGDVQRLEAQVAVMASLIAEVRQQVSSIEISPELSIKMHLAVSATPRVAARLNMQLGKVPGGERILVGTDQEAWRALGTLEFERVYDVLVLECSPKGEQGQNSERD